jgi:hypothetical protein
MRRRCLDALPRSTQVEIIVPDEKQRQADGIVEMWYDDAAAMKKAMDWVQSPEGKIIRDDGDNFVDVSPSPGGGFWIVTENIVKDDISKKK